MSLSKCFRKFMINIKEIIDNYIEANRFFVMSHVCPIKDKTPDVLETVQQKQND